MSTSDGKAGKWTSRAWTPARCTVWKALEGERQKEFERWVEAEPAFNYDEQVAAEWKVDE